MAQPFEGFLLVGLSDRGDLRDEVRGWAGGALEIRGEGVDGRGAGAEDLVPERVGDVPGLAAGALG
eukprot:8364709-Lingulodinium_polyedra.AAC.1